MKRTGFLARLAGAVAAAAVAPSAFSGMTPRVATYAYSLPSMMAYSEAATLDLLYWSVLNLGFKT